MPKYNVSITCEDGTKHIYNNAVVVEHISNNAEHIGDKVVIEKWSNDSITDIATISNVAEVICKPILENLNEVM